MAYEIEIITVPTRTVAATRFHVAEADLDGIGPSMGAAFETVMARLERAGASPAGPAIARYEPAGDGYDVAAGFVVAEPFEPGDEVATLVLGGCEVARTTHVGPYDQLRGAYDALRAGVEARGRALADDAPMWEEYWSGPEVPPEQIRTDVYWPVVAA